MSNHRVKGMIASIWNEMEKNGILRKLTRLNMPTRLPISMIDRIEKKSKEIPPSDVQVQLPDLFDEAVDTVKTYDNMIELLDQMRNDAIEAAMVIRNSYLPDENEVIKGLSSLNEDDKDYPRKSTNLLAKLLGDEAVGVMVNVGIEKNPETDCLNIGFGIKDRPTIGILSIPMEVDYANNWKVYNRFDNSFRDEQGDKRSNVGIDYVESRKIRMTLHVASGMTSKYEAVATVSGLKEASENIVRMVQIDARRKLKDFGGIGNVKSADEFAEWRHRRFADKYAKWNSSEENAE